MRISLSGGIMRGSILVPSSGEILLDVLREKATGALYGSVEADGGYRRRVEAREEHEGLRWWYLAKSDRDRGRVREVYGDALDRYSRKRRQGGLGTKQGT